MYSTTKAGTPLVGAREWIARRAPGVTALSDLAERLFVRVYVAPADMPAPLDERGQYTHDEIAASVNHLPPSCDAKVRNALPFEGEGRVAVLRSPLPCSGRVRSFERSLAWCVATLALEGSGFGDRDACAGRTTLAEIDRLRDELASALGGHGVERC